MRKGIIVEVSAADRARLEALVADRNSPQKHVWRARIVLLTAAGHGTALMRQAGVSKVAVWRWQERFMAAGVEGLLRDKTRPSRIPALGAEVTARVADHDRRSAGRDDAMTAAAMAQLVGISASSVQRIWRAHGRPAALGQGVRALQSSAFADKLRAIVGLYVDPPATPSRVGRREIADTGAGSHPARAADEEGSAGYYDPRLPAQRHYNSIRRTERPRRLRDRAMHATTPAPGVHPLSQPDRAQRAWPGS